jgi:hypothetical protein
MFFLDSFNNTLFDWFSKVKDPFYLFDIHYSFKPLVSAKLLLKDLFSKITFDTKLFAEYQVRVDKGRATRCFMFSGVVSSPTFKTTSFPQSGPCLAYICSEFLKIEHMFKCTPDSANCSRTHLTLKALMKSKSEISFIIEKYKSLPRVFQDLFNAKLGELSE